MIVFCTACKLYAEFFCVGSPVANPCTLPLSTAPSNCAKSYRRIIPRCSANFKILLVKTAPRLFLIWPESRISLTSEMAL